MTDKRITAALERLNDPRFMVHLADLDGELEDECLDGPLAALIRAIDGKYPRGKTISGQDIVVYEAWSALCTAIAPGVEE